jgi:hypothetical protein
VADKIGFIAKEDWGIPDVELPVGRCPKCGTDAVKLSVIFGICVSCINHEASTKTGHYEEKSDG